MKLLSILLSGAGAMLVAAAAPVAPVPRYHVAGHIAGPDGGGWDYVAVDVAARVLYVAHGDAVTRVDLAKRDAGRSIGTIVHGHAVVPLAHGMLLVTSGRDNSVRLIDATTGVEQAKLAVGDDPDAAAYETASGHVFVMNAHDGTISDVDPHEMKVVRTITVKPALEFAVIGRGRTLYVNNEDADEIEVVDLAAGKLVRSIALTGCEGPTGLAFDASHDRLISACANGKAAVVDTRAAKLTGLIDIGRGPDAVMLDAKRQVALIPCGRDGVLEVLSLAARSVRKVATVKTEVGARTGAIDARTGNVYLPTAAFDPPARAGGRPVARAGTFHLLVVAPA
ncbi:YncE family protein [Sphingomonas oligophenolica]|uniref:YncE family protein n=1 Tax=Sphingomonas oligophenolica TaxID=301154 RepID=A0A502CM98_9SPHN|nr:YncE family protein [Sphingomonas oligophenolica]TPG14317.1 YncE family protein [Sphingomonas oligophenolica]